MTDSPSRPPRIPELTGIRGIAAFWVLMFHIWLVAGSPTLRLAGIDFTPVFACGWAGVDLFFVLSGFVLTWPYADRPGQPINGIDFMRRRILRVVPAYYAQFLVLVLLAAFGITRELPSFGNTVSHLLFLHNLSPAWIDPLPKAWWTLPLEWQFYLVFPLLLAAMARFGWRRTLAVLLAMVLAWRIGSFHWLAGHQPEASIDYRLWLIEQIPGRIDQFFVGMLAARLVTRHWSRLTGQGRQRLSFWLALGSFAALVALVYLLWPRAQVYWQGHPLLYIWHSLAALPIAGLIAAAALGGSLTRTLLGNRPLLWLGEISYSLYLWNYVVLLALVRFGVFSGLDGPSRIFRVGLYGILPVLAVAAVSWWLVERPILHYRDRHPGATLGRHLTAFVHAPWRGVAATAALILFVLAAGQLYWLPDEAARAQCSERGAVDPLADNAAVLVGWVHDWRRSNRVRRVLLLDGDRVVAEAAPTVERPDVVAALPLCRIEKPGFEIPLPLDRLPLAGAHLTVAAERSGGQRYSLATLDWRFARPRFTVDIAEPPTANRGSDISGWAWHPAGPVEVRWKQGELVLGKTVADLPRIDVAQAYPNWPHGERSGYHLRIALAQLPRTAGATTLEFIAADGSRSETAGPAIANDAPIGQVLGEPNQRLIAPERIPLEVWAFAEPGLAAVTVETELGTTLGPLHRTRDNAALPGLYTDTRGMPTDERWQNMLKHGELYSAVISGKTLPAGVQRLTVRLRDRRGRESLLPGPLIGSPPPTAACPDQPFTVYLWATTQMLRAGLPQLAEYRRMAESGCARFGIHVRVEYLRTTRGKAADYQFDPDFPDSRRHFRGKEMTTTSLAEALAMADRFAVPMRILLDGGVWADSLFAIPEYDITDWLEQDERNVQWNQFGRAEPDDALQGLAGSHDNPELARVIALNRYNRDYRHYKKRNLQAAVRLIADFNRRHPDRPISISFDPDLYINPWFYLKQWYDYNPDTLRQFREWLTHDGPYASGGELAGQGYRQRLSLAEINRLAHADWSTLHEVDPPRARPDYANPWHQIWTAFKRHLVAAHYADLARWAAEAGLARERILTAQTFIQADVSVTGDDPASGWTDEAGVSIAGAKPADGHMGVILYGPASRNLGTPRSGSSLLANVRRIDPRWESTEMNPADIEQPEHMPDHREAYTTLTEIFNHGARGISPMWTGDGGDQSVRPTQFKSYHTMVRSPFETQLVLFLRNASRFPPGSQLWTFGNDYLASTDGFAALSGARLTPQPGRLRIETTNGRNPFNQTIGIGRDLEGWPVPGNTCAHIDAETAGNIKLLLRDEHGREYRFSAAAGSTEINLDTLAGQRLERLELNLAQPSAAIRLIALGPCHR